jgi:hypothetical protein
MSESFWGASGRTISQVARDLASKPQLHSPVILNAASGVKRASSTWGSYAEVNRRRTKFAVQLFVSGLNDTKRHFVYDYCCEIFTQISIGVRVRCASSE